MTWNSLEWTGDVSGDRGPKVRERVEVSQVVPAAAAQGGVGAVRSALPPGAAQAAWTQERVTLRTTPHHPQQGTGEQDHSTPAAY